MIEAMTCEGWKTGEIGEKPLAQGENQQQTHMAPGKNSTRATLVGDECSNHCAILTLMYIMLYE